MIPLNVTAPAVVFLMLTFMRSPAAAWSTRYGVLRGEGMTPAAPPACTGHSSCRTSDPELTVATRPAAVALMPTSTWAGKGRYSYCHPVSGVAVAPAARDAVNVSCGISTPPRGHHPVREALASVAGCRRG